MSEGTISFWIWLPVLLFLAGCPGERFTPYTSDAGGYSVLLPGSKPPSEGQRGDYRWVMTVYRGVTYHVAYRDIQDLSPHFVRDMLDQGAKSAGAVRRRAEILIDELPGVEYEIKAANGAHKFYRYLQRRKRLYILFVESDELNLEQPAVQRFLASFKVL